LNRGELVVERKCDDVCVITHEEPLEIFFDSQRSVVAPLVICLPGPVPYASEKAIPYKYNATMIEDGREVSVPPLPSMGNIVEDNRVLRNGCVIPVVFPKKVGAPVTEEAQAKDFSVVKDASQSTRADASSDFDEILKLIKKSEYKVVDQLM